MSSLLPFGKLQFDLMSPNKKSWRAYFRASSIFMSHKLISTVLSLLKIFLEFFGDCFYSQFT